MSRVTVIIPAYNAAHTISETLASLQAQTFSDWEALVLDDGSTDETAAVASEFDDSRIRVESFENAGIATGRNRGLERTTTELVAFLDADDLWTPTKLADQVAALDANPNAVVAYSWTDYVDEQSQFICKGFRMDQQGWVFKELLLQNFIENGSNPLVRRTALDETGSFALDVISGEDWDMWLRLAKVGQYVLVPQAQILYRLSATSAAACLNRSEKICCKVLDRHLVDAPADVRKLRRAARGHIYKGLASRAFTSGDHGRKRGWLAARLIVLSLWHRPSYLRNFRLWASMWGKACILLILPAETSKRILDSRSGKN